MPKKILLADDEPDMVALVSVRLKAAGYEVISASDGATALELAKQEQPDLLILDVMMPKLDGFKVCRLLKFDSRYKAIPIMMLTARAQPEDMKLATECGADAYVTKPLDSREFLEKVARLTAGPLERKG